jgi:hypothetical protein
VLWLKRKCVIGCRQWNTVYNDTRTVPLVVYSEFDGVDPLSRVRIRVLVSVSVGVSFRAKVTARVRAIVRLPLGLGLTHTHTLARTHTHTHTHTHILTYSLSRKVIH